MTFEDLSTSTEVPMRGAPGLPLRRSRPVRARRRVGSPRRRRLLLIGGVPTLLAPAVLAVGPVPFLDDYLAAKVSDQITARMACPGGRSSPPQVTLGGTGLLLQLMQGQLSEINLRQHDIAMGDARHADFSATIRDVNGITGDTPRAGSMRASITVPFADLPVPAGQPPLIFTRADDGSLKMSTTTPPGQAKNVTAKLFLQLRLNGENLDAVPQRLQLFGRTLPAAQVTSLTGGVRRQKLPHLPDGLAYTFARPQPDGVHVGLNGTVTTPLSTLPTTVGGRTVSYSVTDGLLGISTSFMVPPIINVPLTIFTAPRLTGTTLTLVPQSVQVLGANRPLNDPIAALVLRQIDQADLTRKLPSLPTGVNYKSVSVDGSGIKVAVGGITVTPFSQLPQPATGKPTVFGAQDGLLTATTRGVSDNGPAMSIILYANPRIVGNNLDTTPQRITLLGAQFPAADVLSQIQAPNSVHPLQRLPAGLTYAGVDVLPTGLRIRVNGTNVSLSNTAMAGMTCPIKR
jgi:LmeA-like phospholipid-binding